MANQFLYTVPYKELSKWYIEQFLRQEVSGKFPMYSLRQILSPIRDRVSSNNYSIQIPLVAKIRFTDGKLFYRTGEKPKNDVFIARKGDLLVSNINFEKGAFCLVEDDILACSTDYQPYEIINDKVVPKFLEICLRSNKFLENVAKAKPKGMKTRAKWDFIQTFKIPLPNIEEQQRILDEYEKKIAAAEVINENYIQFVNEFLNKKLDLQINYKTQNNYLSFTNFVDLKRWDVQNINSSTFIQSKFPLISLNKLIKNWMSKNAIGLAINTNMYPNEKFHYLGMENVKKDMGDIIDLPCQMGKEIKSTTIKVPKGYIIYNKLRPYLNKYWINTTSYEDIVCSSEFFVFDIVENINKYYFVYVLSSEFVQKQIESLFSGARMPRINKEIFFNIKIPLPSIEMQNDIVDFLNEHKYIIKKNGALKYSLIQQAKENFENAIFN